jgi:X-X-X-Leu-X-X-Gly heptad repeat protein
MHNAGDLAALVAAFFFATGVCAGVYVLIRLARLISEGTRLVADMRSRSDTVFEQVQAALDRANQQLDATSTVTAGMDELNEGMSQLTDQVSALAGLGHAIATGPAGRVGAFVYGVRHAVSIRRDGTVRPERAARLAAPVETAPVETPPVETPRTEPGRTGKQPKAINGGRRSLARSGGRR